MPPTEKRSSQAGNCAERTLYQLVAGLTNGLDISVKKQWWLKVNAKRVRLHAMDGAMFPHIVKVEYTVDEQTYTKRKWIGAGYPTPSLGRTVTVLYDENTLARAKVV